MNNEASRVMAELLAEVHEMRTDTKSQLTNLNQDVQEMKKEIALDLATAFCANRGLLL